MHKDFPIAIVICPILWVMACGLYAHLIFFLENKKQEKHKIYANFLLFFLLILILYLAYNMSKK
jgi:hypothetical protein